MCIKSPTLYSFTILEVTASTAHLGNYPRYPVGGPRLLFYNPALPEPKAEAPCWEPAGRTEAMASELTFLLCATSPNSLTSSLRNTRNSLQAVPPILTARTAGAGAG